MSYQFKKTKDSFINDRELRDLVFKTLDSIGKRENVLVVPPDFTRFHSMAGRITEFVYAYYREKIKAILPATGTHFPMTHEEISIMFPSIPEKLFVNHNWRDDILTLGTVPSSFISEVSDGKLNFDWPAQVNRLLADPELDLILSIGQVLPHEVIGMANHNKNISVGTGGAEGINKSHYLGAVYGMERIMGKADTPVRRVLNYASQNFAGNLPLFYIQTVLAKDTDNKLRLKGYFSGKDEKCFLEAAKLAYELNFKFLEKPLKKVVVYLDPGEYKSTWLGNKSVYRTRMAIQDGGELIVLAPGLQQFGEDKTIDNLIRKYGYVNTPEILDLVKRNTDLQENLSAAAHLIHGSTENRFTVTYCPGYLTDMEIRSVNYNFGDLNEYVKTYKPDKLVDGFNVLENGEKIYYISNPALGLWKYGKE